MVRASARARPGALAILLTVVTSCGGANATPSPIASPGASEIVIPTARPTSSALASPSPIGRGRVEKGTFHSNALSRTMQFVVYLPPGYDANPNRRYPTAYLLHGGGGDIMEWPSYGAFDQADKLMGDQEIAPFIIVLPEGDQEYWVDHVIDARTGANGEKWGTYTAKEVVPAIDARFRTIAHQDARALGGISMGGHAAMQLSLNFPGIWSAIGAHTPSLRPEGEAPTYLGSGDEFAARDPASLIKAKPDVARAYRWWLDAGTRDPWRRATEAIHNLLTDLGVAHEWSVTAGGHDLAYWSAHMSDYIRYYGTALCKGRTTC